ncbi:hypothetical protein AGLY_002417 [Aphis glycines]|uniref:Uncharacterized protein n=1 Tax=Aphis glycines TaxID=307491 RepID=A0A6G0U3T5_APHGL|nr:hypothetical protein AGLY_002417 [Aphis glycines]
MCQLLYATPIWSSTDDAMARTRPNLRRSQRVAALRTIRAYRTVSDDAAFFLAGMPPVDLIAAERARVAELPPLPGERPPRRALSKGLRGRSPSPSGTTDGCVPGRCLGLIGSLRTLPGGSTGRFSRCPGHGCFQHYLHRMGKVESPGYMHCPCASDTAEHTLFRCPNRDGLREGFRARLGRSSAAGGVPDIPCGPIFKDLPFDLYKRQVVLSEPEETFRIFYKMVIEILTLKEQEERVRQAAEPWGNQARVSMGVG